MRNHYEHDHQVALFQWADCQKYRYPELATMFAVPNSARRSPRQGAWMKAEGLRAGVWDIFLPAPRGKLAGLFIEMKAPKGKLTTPQIEFRDQLHFEYDFSICRSWIEATNAILEYLKTT